MQIKSDEPSYEDLKRLKYLEMVQKEVLRMDSSISMIFPRVVVKDHFLGNLKMVKGMQVAPRLRSIHYRDTTYADPLHFRPERWE